MPLQDIPFYGVYVQKRMANEAQPMQQLKQAAGALELQQAMSQQEQDAQLRQAITASGGDLQKVMNAALASGNIAAAAKLAPLITASRPKAESFPEIVRLQTYLKELPEGDPHRKPIEQRIELLSTREQSQQVSPLGRLMAERDALPPGDPRRKSYDDVISRQGQAPGISITGPLIGMPLGKESSNKVDTGLLDTTSRVMRLNEIGSQFKPEYLTYATKGTNWWNAVKEKAGFDLSQQEKSDLTGFAGFKRNAVQNLNEYIQSVTGAAMSETEVPRIKAGVPNPGTGMFDGDSPTEFKSKFDDTIRQLKMAEARFAYIKRNGMSLTDASGKPVISLDQMPSLMNKRGKEIEAGLKKSSPNVSDAELRKAVRAHLAREFGLVE